MFTCPFCKSHAQPREESRMSTAGIVCLLAGFCLTPFIIGLALIPIAFFLKDSHHICADCNVKLD